MLPAGRSAQPGIDLFGDAARGPVAALLRRHHRARQGQLDLFLLQDESLEDSANPPEPHVLAQEIADDLRAALPALVNDRARGDKRRGRSSAVARPPLPRAQAESYSAVSVPLQMT